MRIKNKFSFFSAFGCYVFTLTRRERERGRKGERGRKRNLWIECLEKKKGFKVFGLNVDYNKSVSDMIKPFIFLFKENLLMTSS